jgi:hypothetical protein
MKYAHRRSVLMTLHLEAGAALRRDGRQPCGSADGFDARKRGERLDRPGCQVRASLRRPLRADQEAEREHPIGVKACIRIEETNQAARQHYAAGQHDDGDGDLDHDEPGSEQPAGSLCAAAAAETQARRKAPSRKLGHGREPDQDAAEGHGDDRNGDHRRAERDVVDERHAIADQRRQRVDTPARQQQAQGSAARDDQEAFRQELPRQPGTRSAECRAHGQLLRPHRHPREHQAGDVHARDDQEPGHGAERHEERGSRITDQPLANGDGRELDVLVRFRVGLLQPLRESGQLRGGLPWSRVGREPADGGEDPQRPVLRLGRRLSHGVTHADPELELARRKAESRRHDPDDRERLVREAQRPADDGRIAAHPPQPEPVREHHRRSIAVALRDQAAHQR